MAAYDDLNGTRIATISVISIVATAVTVLAVQVMYFAMAGFVDQRKVDSATYSRQNKILADQADEVTRFGIDPQSGKVIVPVDTVFQKMVARKGDEQT